MILLREIHFSKNNIRRHNRTIKIVIFLIIQCSQRQKSFSSIIVCFQNKRERYSYSCNFFHLFVFQSSPLQKKTIPSGFRNGQLENVYGFGCVRSIRTFGTRFIYSRFFYFSKNKKKISFNSDLCVPCVLFSRPFFNQPVDRLGGGREGFGCPGPRFH